MKCGYFIIFPSIKYFGENMGFLDNITGLFGDGETALPVFRAVLLGDNALYLECVKKIVRYSPEEITVSLKNGGITVRGEKLYIKKYCAGDLAVCGKIKTLERT